MLEQEGFLRRHSRNVDFRKIQLEFIREILTESCLDHVIGKPLFQGK